MAALDRRSRIPARMLMGLVLGLGLLTPACSQKPARTMPPVLVPSIEAEPQPVPEPPPALETEPAPEPQANPPQSNAKPRSKPHKPVPHKPTETAKPEPLKPEVAKPEPPKADTPATSVQITADVPRAAVQSQTQITEQLLRNSELKLASLNRALNESEQAMSRQARNYIAQSHQALQTGEIERAYNLAVKASLLANDLAK